MRRVEGRERRKRKLEECQGFILFGRKIQIQTQLGIHSVNKYSLSTYYMSYTTISNRNILVNET